MCIRDRFKNVTNVIAHRRWLCQANPELTAFLKERIGDGFVLNAEELSRLKPYADDAAAREVFAAIKRRNKVRLSDYLFKTSGIRVDPDSLFDIQVKRLHEYKRQPLHALDVYKRQHQHGALLG